MILTYQWRVTENGTRELLRPPSGAVLLSIEAWRWCPANGTLLVEELNQLRADRERLNDEVIELRDQAYFDDLEAQEAASREAAVRGE